VPTLDGKLLAYTLKPNNADEATLYVKNVETGENLPGEVIEGAKYAGPSWMLDGSDLFTLTCPPPIRTAQTGPALPLSVTTSSAPIPKRSVIHPKTGDATKFISSYISRDVNGSFLCSKWLGQKRSLLSALHGQPTASLADDWAPIVVGKDFLYSLYPWKGQAYILTNEDAPRYRLFKVASTIQVGRNGTRSCTNRPPLCSRA